MIRINKCFTFDYYIPLALISIMNGSSYKSTVVDVVDVVSLVDLVLDLVDFDVVEFVDVDDDVDVDEDVVDVVVG